MFLTVDQATRNARAFVTTAAGEAAYNGWSRAADPQHLIKAARACETTPRLIRDSFESQRLVKALELASQIPEPPPSENKPLMDVVSAVAELDRDLLFRLCYELDPRSITLATPALEQPPAGWVQLPSPTAAMIVSIRAAHLTRVLAGRTLKSSFATMGGHVIKQLQRETPVTRELDILLDLSATAARVYYDPGTGRVSISAPVAAAPAALTGHIDAVASETLLRTMLRIDAQSSKVDAALRRLTSAVPHDVFRIAERAQMADMAILRSRYPLSAEARWTALLTNMGIAGAVGTGVGFGLQSLGVPDLAAALPCLLLQLGAHIATLGIPAPKHFAVRWLSHVRTGGRTLGHVSFETNGFAAAVMDDSDDIAHTLAHEFFHLLDFCLADHGSLSDEDEFRAIFDKTCEADARGDLIPGFPSAYARRARTRPELFAECAAAYCNLLLSTDREERLPGGLAQANPEAYAYMERLFTERLPALVADGRGQRFATAWADVEDPHRAAATAPEERTANQWLSLAGVSMRRAALLRDGMALAHANEAIGKAQSSARVTEPGFMGNELDAVSRVRGRFEALAQTFSEV